MHTEKEIMLLFIDWLRVHFKASDLFIKEEVQLKIDDFVLEADLIAIQSKSNVIHGFEMKNTINKERILSAIWQAYSYYTNYRWLVVMTEKKDLIVNSEIKEKLLSLGVGLILFSETKKEFRVVADAKYIDGNFLKFWPDLSDDWGKGKKSSKR